MLIPRTNLVLVAPSARPLQETGTGTATDPAAAGSEAPPADAEKKGSPWGGFLTPMLIVFAIFYFVLILPERKKQKARQALLGGLKKGDKVMTTGGMYGSVAQVQDDLVTLQVADGVRLRFARQAIQNVIQDEPKEAAKPTLPPAPTGNG